MNLKVCRDKPTWKTSENIIYRKPLLRTHFP